ncbi:TPA: hypothetical protein HA361_04165 [Candidatus Woesearchaeota archaeon]|nr:hypothetical protein [Candidatus Woesearchaeota archaeon]HII69216.1 hypothetical protein [Candidatus Woesearchaeota archaeon]
MAIALPQYGLKAYAVLYARYGAKEAFRQSALEWIVSTSMKKKIFALLLKSGWIKKDKDNTYRCINPSVAIRGLLDFRVPLAIKTAKRPYAFTGASAVEIWSDYAYMQRGMEKSPYYMKVLQKDVHYWKDFFSSKEIPSYTSSGSTIGEYIILVPVTSLSSEEKDGFRVDGLKESIAFAHSNEIYAYASSYMERKYGAAA